jgi:hypothetical protein
MDKAEKELFLNRIHYAIDNMKVEDIEYCFTELRVYPPFREIGRPLTETIFESIPTDKVKCELDIRLSLNKLHFLHDNELKAIIGENK